MNKNESLLIGELIGKVDSLIYDIKRLRETTEGEDKKIGTEVHDLEVRVSSLEKKQFAIVLIATVVWTGALAFLRKFNFFG